VHESDNETKKKKGDPNFVSCTVRMLPKETRQDDVAPPGPLFRSKASHYENLGIPAAVPAESSNADRRIQETQ
jgi:hypothetical protein